MMSQDHRLLRLLIHLALGGQATGLIHLALGGQATGLIHLALGGLAMVRI